jgi:4'-phosphopantetheinyl transferase
MRSPDAVPPLGPLDCQVWWAGLAEHHPNHHRLLDPVELHRRSAYRREDDRRRFVLGAVVARVVLGRHLGLAPDRVPLDRTCAGCGRSHGRPRPPADAGVELSVSHSGDWVLVAVTAGAPVGVDIERLDPAAADEIARSVLAPAERTNAEPTDAERADAVPGAGLFRYWVRKEAALKATGDGLRVAMTELTVTPPDRPARLVAWTGRPDLPARLHLVDLAGDPAYAASVAVIGAAPVIYSLPARDLLRDLAGRGP